MAYACKTEGRNNRGLTVRCRQLHAADIDVVRQHITLMGERFSTGSMGSAEVPMAVNTKSIAGNVVYLIQFSPSDRTLGEVRSSCTGIWAAARFQASSTAWTVMT